MQLGASEVNRQTILLSRQTATSLRRQCHTVVILEGVVDFGEETEEEVRLVLEVEVIKLSAHEIWKNFG